MREVPVAGGYVTLVDDEDYDRATEHRWHAAPTRFSLYAATNLRAPAGSRRRQIKLTLHQMLTGWPLTDHINGNGLDNQRANLRPATRAELNRSHRLRSDNTTGYKGVTREPNHRWAVRIGFEGRRLWVGRYGSAVEAARAYDKAALELFGEFARLNFPEG